MSKQLWLGIALVLSVSSVSNEAHADELHLFCESTYEPTLDVRVNDEKVQMRFQDEVERNYRFVADLFRAAGKSLPTVTAKTRFEFSTEAPLVYSQDGLEPEKLTLATSDSEILPGFGKGLMHASSAYNRHRPTVTITLTWIEPGQPNTQTKFPMLFNSTATKFQNVQEEHAGPFTYASQTLKFELDLSEASTPPGKTAARAILGSVRSPYGGCSPKIRN